LTASSARPSLTAVLSCQNSPSPDCLATYLGCGSDPATARANFQVIPWTSPVWLGLNAGASLVKRGGAAYENAEDKTDIGGVIGTTVGFNLGGLLSFYVAAEDYIYGTTFVESGTLEEKRTQNDVQLAVGFGVPLQR
jgi:uncharacterized membrane protein